MRMNLKPGKTWKNPGFCWLWEFWSRILGISKYLPSLMAWQSTIENPSNPRAKVTLHIAKHPSVPHVSWTATRSRSCRISGSDVSFPLAAKLWKHNAKDSSVLHLDVVFPGDFPKVFWQADWYNLDMPNFPSTTLKSKTCRDCDVPYCIV